MFNLINLVVLRYVFRGLTRNTRLIWLGLWIFFIINWVGQDYFSPQAMAYVLYLACIGLLIRRVDHPRSMLVAFVLVVSVVAASHQITPMMLLLAVTALVVLRRTPGWYLPVLAAAATAAWALTRRPQLHHARHHGAGRRASGSRWPTPARPWRRPPSSPAGSQLLVVWGGRGRGDRRHRDGPARRLAELAGPRPAGHRRSC